MKVLITGSGGFIGSATVEACEEAGIQVVALTRGDRSDTSSAQRVTYFGEIGDRELVGELLAEHPDIDGVLHIAARSSVSESHEDPLRCFEDNVADTVRFFRSVQRSGITRLVFSSSGAVYAPARVGSVREDAPVEWADAYVSSKLMCEHVIRETAAAGGLRALSLRYANVVGAAASPRGVRSGGASSVLPVIIEAAGGDKTVAIAGTDWPTRDGSALREFIHVRDVALANVAAIQRLDDVTSPEDPFRIINIGTGAGTTVRELIAAVEGMTGRPVRSSVAERRTGDRAGAVMNVERAAELLGWRATISIDDAIRDILVGCAAEP